MRKLLALLIIPAFMSGCRACERFFDRLTASPSIYGAYQIHEGRSNDAVFGASITFYERGERPAIPAVPNSYSNDVRVYGSSSSSSSSANSSSSATQSQGQAQTQSQGQTQTQSAPDHDHGHGHGHGHDKDD